MQIHSYRQEERKYHDQVRLGCRRRRRGGSCCSPLPFHAGCGGAKERKRGTEPSTVAGQLDQEKKELLQRYRKEIKNIYMSRGLSRKKRKAGQADLATVHGKKKPDIALSAARETRPSLLPGGFLLWDLHREGKEVDDLSFDGMKSVCDTRRQKGVCHHFHMLCGQEKKRLWATWGRKYRTTHFKLGVSVEPTGRDSKNHSVRLRREEGGSSPCPRFRVGPFENLKEEGGG